MEECDFVKSNTPPWVFFTFFELYKSYQIAQNTTMEMISNFNQYKFKGLVQAEGATRGVL